MTLETLGKGFAVTLSALFMVACSTTSDTDSAGVADTSANDTSVAQDVETAEERERRLAAERAEIDRKARQVRTVYFDFDESSVRSEFVDLLRLHAAYLSNNRATQLVIEGHADERGTPEYNLALGERRGNAIRDIMISYGVSSSQIRVVSYGEEKPANPGHNESSWEKNRRAVLDYEG